MTDKIHASDCALHNAPALPVGPCDCGATDMSADEVMDRNWREMVRLFNAASNENKALLARISRLYAALDQVEDYLEGKVDVVDGSYGEPAPNREMQLMTEIQEARGTLIR